MCKDPSLPERTLVSLQAKIKEAIKPTDVAAMMELDFSEMEAGGRVMPLEDCKFLSLLQNEIHLEDGHYEMPLPFKAGRPALPNNKSMAKEPIAFICDIERMFHQFRVIAKDGNYLRFLWWKNGDWNIGCASICLGESRHQDVPTSL